MGVSQFQQIIYEGYLTADPEMRYLENGTAVTNFRIGSNRSYKKDDKDVQETTWLKIVTWGKLAENINDWCAKGSHVIVIGRLRVGENGNPEVYETRSGGHGASYEITAERVRILKGKDKSSTEKQVDEDIPF